MESMTFGEYLKRLRKAKGFSSTYKLSLSADVSQAFISQIENGRRVPSPEIIRKISNALGVTHIGMMIRAGHVTEEEVLTYRRGHGIHD